MSHHFIIPRYQGISQYSYRITTALYPKNGGYCSSKRSFDTSKSGPSVAPIADLTYY
jgi:hypothetical protein